MSEITYNKLVRDNIPRIIEESGEKCDVEVLSEANYLFALERKMDEEMKEFRESHDLEELADLMEVIIAAAEAIGSSSEELESIRLEKRNARGGFSKRILLKSVSDEN